MSATCLGPIGRGLLIVCSTAALASSSAALGAERYALVVTGASGGPQYAEKYAKWRGAFVHTLRDTFHYPADHVVVLGEDGGENVGKATGENVRRALAEFSRRTTNEDTVLVLLIGHGSGGDTEEARFNLVGPDLSASQWAELLRPIRGRIIFVDTSSASFPFLQKLGGAKDRIVVTATDSVTQQFETVFPEFFVKAFDDQAADLDKNGRVSIWEAFSYASKAVERWFAEHGRLRTERPLLDDTGRGIGREADVPGSDGSLAQATYLQPQPSIAISGDTELDELLRRREELRSQLEELRARRSAAAADAYQAELEKLLLELARVERRIREKS